MSARNARVVWRARCARIASHLLPLLFVPFCTVAAQPSLPRSLAWRFTYAVSPTADGKPLPAGNTVLDVVIWAGTARITVREGALKAIVGESGVILLRSGDSTLAIVNPAKREVLKVATGEFGGLISGPAGSMPLEVSDVTSATRSLGAGPRVLGYPTRRISLSQGYTLRLTTPVGQRTIRTDQELLLTVSRDIARLDPGFRSFADQFARSLGLPGPVRRKLRDAERAVPPGFPVLTLTTAVTVSGLDTLRSTTRAEMTALRRDTVDTAGFAIPADYRVTEMSRLLQRPRRP